jgi:hypothetical protein
MCSKEAMCLGSHGSGSNISTPTAFTAFTRLQYTIHSGKVKVGSPSKTKTKPANASIIILSSLHWLHCVPAETQIKDATTNEIDTHRRIELIGIEQ